MDGVFMKNMIKWIGILLAFVFSFTLLDAYRDRQLLRGSVIRLHVVGASDGHEDQSVKLHVRDAVLAWIEEETANIGTAEEANAFLSAHLPELEQVANHALSAAGSEDCAAVTLLEEAFPVRDYETFSLPSGVYRSLRIRIGEAQGKNWWCVVFPTLCLGTTTAEMRDTAASAGFDETLTNTLSGERGYELRFFLLDCIGMLENFLHMG